MSPHRFAEITQLAEEFFDLAPIGMAILRLEDPADPESFRVIALNPAAQVAADLAAAAVGKRIDEDFPAIATIAFPGKLAEVIRSGIATNLGEAPGQNDPNRLFTVTAFPIPPDCVGLLFGDITERRKAQRRAHESELRYRKIFEASTAAICIFDANAGTFIDANSRFTELLGLGGASQLLGKKIDAFGFWSDGDSGSEYTTLLERLRADHSIREAAVTFRTYGGQVRRALVALELFEAGDAEYILGIFWRV
jgi:PAS domain S-box-containing protein